MSKPRVTLITVVGDYAGMLAPMLRHYRSIGVDDLIVHANVSSPDDPVYHQILRVAGECGARVLCRLFKRWVPDDNTFLYKVPRCDEPDRWFILADQDELQVYPDTVGEIAAYCERNSYDFVEGCFVDRHAPDGVLREPQATSCLWEQYPVGSMLTGRILQGVTAKVVLLKGKVNISGGQHRANTGHGCPPEELYIPVHHFKWVPGAVERLTERAASFPKSAYSGECRRFLEYFDRESRINLSDPELLAGICSPDYPFWDRVREWRIQVSCFLPKQIKRW